MNIEPPNCGQDEPSNYPGYEPLMTPRQAWTNYLLAIRDGGDVEYAYRLWIKAQNVPGAFANGYKGES